jgi:Fe-S-cluster-containing dehydrogenase component/anaerobic selenocysteine-containing dehydrogenase
MSEHHNTDVNHEASAPFIPPRHWLGTEELSESYWNDPKIKEKRGQEFYDKPVETLDLIQKLDTQGIARRDFLTIMGASMALASFACARRPVHKIIPYVVKPEEITGGIANYYATTCPETGYGLLAKVREGRPIKLEGNPEYAIGAKGAISARTHAHILNLYDMDRAKEPKRMGRGKSVSGLKWEELDAEVVAKLKESKSVRILTGKILGDSTLRLINEFMAAFSNAKHISIDELGVDDLVEGQAESYGSPVLPHYRFDEADVVFSIGADFLGTWGTSEEFSADWMKKRQLNAANAKSATMSKLYVAESMFTVTGANADERFPLRSGDEVKIAGAVAHLVAKKKGLSLSGGLASYAPQSVSEDTGIALAKLEEIASALVSASGKSLVIAGGVSSKTESALALQVIVNFLNSSLGNEGATVDGTAQASSKVGRAQELSQLIQEMNSGSVGALIIHNANPSYTLPQALGFDSALTKVGMILTTSDREDETSLHSDFLAPDHHFLENWGDSQFRGGSVSLQQPTLAPIHSTRAFQDSLLSWIRVGKLSARGLASTIANSAENNVWHDYLKANWKETYARGVSFDGFWETSLRNGVLKSNVGRASSRSFRAASLSAVPVFQKSSNSSMVLALYSKVSIGDGAFANNPWLQEMPDPITTATWDNYLNISPASAEKMGLKQDDVVEVSSGDFKVDLPVNVQPGLHAQTVTAAIGYGRTAVGKVGNGVGKDVKGFARLISGRLALSGHPVSIKKTGRRYQIALTQWHNASENRPIVNDISLAQFKKDPHTANHTDPHLRLDEVPSMWPSFEYKGHRWGMAIDLSACTGCGACIIGCQAENNIPVVGRDNVRRSREMHWIRIDRYYSGPAENPDVSFLPMLCQHCENAPCETVCPVLATVHDDEGLNSQVYNRCVGTRYCQNNCPYKVRRFNFFDHWKSYEGTMNLAWNPDVTVRTRGIMEKCTFCVQRIRDAKDHAKDEGRKVRDGEIKTACQQTCPTDAIVFGDINDPNSRVSKLQKDARAFRSLESLNTKPAISYLSKVRNKVMAEHHAEAHGATAGGEHHE